MQDARIRIALIVICLACLAGSGFVLMAGHPSPPPIVLAPPPETKPAEPSGTAPTATAPHRARPIYVDVAGAVRRPSLYVLRPDSRVMQAVMAAGGPTAAADMDAVNLAQVVTDGEKVFVPKRGAAVTPSSPALPAAPSAALASPMPSPVKTGKDSQPKSSHAKSSAGKSSGGRQSSKISADSGEQVGLNSANLEQLERLPGVGPGMAAKIIAYRDQAGGFSKIEDLTLVPGIGPKKFAKIAPFVTLD